MRPRNHSVPLAESQQHVIDPTNPRGALDDGIEDRLHVRGRPADDAEHLGCCGLMLQGLPQFCIALLDLFEQAHVLDSDHRLVGERFEELDMFLGERTNLHSTDHDRPDRTPSRNNGVASTVRTPMLLAKRARKSSLVLLSDHECEWFADQYGSARNSAAVDWDSSRCAFDDLGNGP